MLQALLEFRQHTYEDSQQRTDINSRDWQDEDKDEATTSKVSSPGCFQSTFVVRRLFLQRPSVLQTSRSDNLRRVHVASCMQWAQPEKLAEGQTWTTNDFSMGRVLGTGSFGRVSLATHKEKGFVCAIKALSKAHIVKNQQAREHILEFKETRVVN